MAASGGDVVLGEKSWASCALASSGGRLHLAWTGSDMRLNTMVSPDGWSFGGKQTLRHRSYTIVTRDSGYQSTGSMSTMSSTTRQTVPLGPALAGTPDGLHLAWTGTDHRLNVWALHHGDAGQTVLGERTAAHPALAAWGDEVVLGWTGGDRHLNLLRGRGGWWGGKWRSKETSSAAPGICAVGGGVAVAWAGTDRRLNLIVGQGGGWGPPVTLRETSYGAPALCAAGDALVLGWTGTDRHVNVLVLWPGRTGSPVRLEAKSSHSPALCLHGEAMVLAWTGTDQRINISHLPLPG